MMMMTMKKKKIWMIFWKMIQKQTSRMLQGKTPEHTHTLLNTLFHLTQCFCRFSVENAYIDEKVDACDALGEIAFNTG